MYARNSILTSIIDRQMESFAENGIFDKTLKTMKNDCHENFAVVSFGFVKILFIILVTGFALSLVILILEKLKIQSIK